MTTKLRAVFDASTKTRTVHSINDTLLPGPNLNTLLTFVLYRFQEHCIALTSDISKMFREIVLDDSEHDFHRFFIGVLGEKFSEWRMKRLTFRVTSSPFLATQVLHQLAQIKQHSHPHASSVILSSFYVDDCLTGASSVEEASSLQKELCDLLQSAGMTMRKWHSNSSHFLETVPEHLHELADLYIPKEPSDSLKTLGIHWHIGEDQFYILTPLVDSTQPPTKRDVVSITARVFHALGWFAPATLLGKILMQDLWKLGIDWDFVVPGDLLAGRHGSSSSPFYQNIRFQDDGPRMTLPSSVASYLDSLMHPAQPHLLAAPS